MSHLKKQVQVATLLGEQKNLDSKGKENCQMDDVTLNNGLNMPQLGFGVWQVEDDKATRRCC
jgi:hypothetical protein